ncbi:hypothetical protein RRF57_010752 [Xylaria bambusicola]|uniref:Uncharacterized protein n=1 Tax=Xylaria bambusicola TaxID=326684 RepID=A0AAN7ULQ3_9PEZI
MRLIDNVYSKAQAYGSDAITFSDLQGSHTSSPLPDLSFHWPPVDSTSKKAVKEQIADCVSIYDNSGIFGKFEKAWREGHGVPDSFALLHNSGTNALQALYFAAQFQPGDEASYPNLPNNLF